MSVYALFRQTAERFPERPFLVVLQETAAIYGVEPGEITYGAASAEVERLRGLYEAAGYGIGHRVGLLLENRPAFVLHFLALNGVGASIVPVNPDLRAAELEYLAGHSELALAVAVPPRHDDLRAAFRAAGRDAAVIGPDDAPPPPAAPRTGTAADEGTEAAILYTSGTTGLPKGCILPNGYFLQCARWYPELGGANTLHETIPDGPHAGEGERMINPLPLFHMNALACSLMGMIAVGGALCVPDRFHPRSWWASVREARATCLHYLGVMPPMLMNLPPSPEDRDHAVRWGFGAGVPPALHAPFEERFGFPLAETWAMTETGTGGVINAHVEPRLVGTATFGRATFDGPVGRHREVEVRIADENGGNAAVGQPGELLVRRAGPDPRAGFFAGYLKDAEATAKAWEGGWLHTGDVVSRDADGNLFFLDRRKNVIRRSGENIAAVEVESVVREHPAVLDVGVAPVPDPVRGDEVFAAVVSDEAPSEELARAIVFHTLERLAYHKAPGHVLFVPELPVTSTNKVKRQDLKELALAAMDGGTAFDTTGMKKRGAPDASARAASKRGAVSA